MTWSATFKVEDVSEGPAPIAVLAVARADEQRETTDSNGNTVTVPRIMSNTEGKIRAIEVKFVIDADETSLRIGDEFYASGHFSST